MNVLIKPRTLKNNLMYRYSKSIIEIEKLLPLQFIRIKFTKVTKIFINERKLSRLSSRPPPNNYDSVTKRLSGKCQIH